MQKEILEQIDPEEQKKHDNPHHPSMFCHLKRLAESAAELLIYEAGLDQSEEADNQPVSQGRQNIRSQRLSRRHL
jgi:hypothetical protein